MSEGIAFGRYRLMYLLGEGGMAKVYRAVLSGPMGFEKDVALKRLDPRLTADERMVRSLVNEARLGGQLRHKNIVEIYEFNSVQANYYMAMEYVDGWTLDAVLATARRRGVFLPPSVVVEILSSVCKGLHFAHTLESKDGTPLNLVHRDLKPGNVIVSRDGDVKILDFGIAKADTNLYKTTAADVTKGTPSICRRSRSRARSSTPAPTSSPLAASWSSSSRSMFLSKGDNLLAIMHAVLNADVESSLAEVSRTCPLMTPVIERSMARRIAISASRRHSSWRRPCERCAAPCPRDRPSLSGSRRWERRCSPSRARMTHGVLTARRLRWSPPVTAPPMGVLVSSPWSPQRPGRCPARGYRRRPLGPRPGATLGSTSTPTPSGWRARSLPWGR